MYIVSSFDFFGGDAELKKWDKAWKKACEETDGISYRGRYTSHQARYHWCYLYEIEGCDLFMAAMSKIPLERDRNVTTHNIIEILSGPMDE